jgi:hypoxanthine phosphoribosyltransferase
MRLIPVLSEKEILAKMQKVAVSVEEDFSKEPFIMVVVLKGAICFAADLLRFFSPQRCRLEVIKASRYKGTKAGELLVFGWEDLEITGCNVLLVDDIFDEGITLQHIYRHLLAKQPKQLRSLVLLKKNIERKVSYEPDWSLFEVGEGFVVGYGLDYQELYRELRGIYRLER